MKTSNNFHRYDIQNASMAENATRYYRALMYRAERNLEAAKERGDTRAVENIKRKIEIYKYTIKLISETDLMFN